LIAVAFAVALATPSLAVGAQLITRNASHVRIDANKKGEAMVTFRSGGVLRHVLLWGAINALAPSPGAHQVRFQVDYSGGWARYRTVYWQHFGGKCRAYDGPKLAYLVAACKAPDGSYWAAQSWPQPLPNLGFTPWRSAQRATWLEISHWSGPVAMVETGTAWLGGGRYENVFGRVTYRGGPVYGFHTTRAGAPTDGFGRLVYLDTFASVYGPGWRRENSFVTHKPTGVFCYGLSPRAATGPFQHPAGMPAMRGPATGQKYRLTVSGPGVTPNVAVIVPGLLHPFRPWDPADVAWQQKQTARLRSWRDRLCS
jgi:hypothetical protein